MAVLLTVRGPQRETTQYVTLGPEFLCGDWTSIKSESTCSLHAHDLTCRGLFPKVDMKRLDQQAWLRGIWDFRENLLISSEVVVEALADLARARAKAAAPLCDFTWVVVVPVRQLEDLVFLRKQQSAKNSAIQICAALDINAFISGPESPQVADSLTTQKLDFSTRAIEKPASRSKELEINKLYCWLKEGVMVAPESKAYFGCLYAAADLSEYQLEIVGSVCDRFPAARPVLLTRLKLAAGYTARLNIVAPDNLGFSSQLKIGTLSWRAFGGEGWYARWLMAETSDRTMCIAAHNILNFDWDTVVEVKVSSELFSCDWCNKEFYCRDEPLRKFTWTYCSVPCVAAHRESNWKALGS